MTAFLTRDSTHLGTDRIFTSPTATALYENLLAAFEKDATAVSAGVVLANSYVVEAMIAASAVAQGKLKTALNTITPAGGVQAQTALSGGQYCFMPTAQIGAGSGTDRMGMIAGGAVNVSGGASQVEVPLQDSGGTGVQTKFTVNLSRATEYTLVMYETVGDDVFTVRARYVQASPPYDLGEGHVPLFVFVHMSSLGAVKDVWIANDPPWAHNGPTKITPHYTDKQGRQFRFERLISDADRLALRDPLLRPGALAKIRETPYTAIEVTQELKNRDMPLIPQPFFTREIGDTVVLLPVSDMLHDLCTIHECGESLGELLHKGYLKIGNEPLNRVSPDGVLAAACTWKQTI